MKKIILIGILFLLSGFFTCQGANKIRYTVKTTKELEDLFSEWHDSLNIILGPGEFHLTPKYEVDTNICSSRGKAIPVRYTYGLRINARYVRITGSEKFGSMIFTNSGYGILFENCGHAIMEGVIITAGQRDRDSMATDAAVVIRNSTVDIINNIIFDNKGDSGMLAITHEGIMGICVREGGHAYISDNQIGRNSWNGIGVLKDATATIEKNVIDGVDNYYQNVGYPRLYHSTAENLLDGGRGIGILFTRNAKGSVTYNIIKRYRCGIGIFVSADASINNNVIENIKTWGICIWDGDSGRPVARIDKNVIFKTGACGIGIIRYDITAKADPGYVKNNIMVETAQDRNFDAPDRYCYQCALAVQAAPRNFIIDKNVFYQNRWLSPCSSDQDMMLPEFLDVLQTRFADLPTQWFSLYSEFIQRFYDYVPLSQRAVKQ
jgi:hypothetical protein